MPYDGILIHFLTSELSEKLVGGKINKIIEPNALDLCLQIRSKDQTDKQIKNLLGDQDIFFVHKGTNIKEYIYL